MRGITFTRNSYIAKGSVKVADKVSDAVAYLSTDTRGRAYATVFFGKQQKPVSHGWYRSETSRNAHVKQLFESRRASVAFKAKMKADRKMAENPYKVGDLFKTSWGYDQTNTEYFEVTEVRGMHVILREIAQERTETGFMCGKCVPLRGSFLAPRYEGDSRGQPIRRLAQKHGIKIDDVRWASPVKMTEIAGVQVTDSSYWSSYA